jgi:hypothetical protein
MTDITGVLIELLSTLIDRGFQLPIYIFVVSQNGNVVAAKYEGNPLCQRRNRRLKYLWSILKIPIGNCL